MSMLQALVLVLAALALGVAVGRLGMAPNRGTLGSRILAGLTALPFALVIAGPFAPDEPDHRAGPSPSAGPQRSPAAAPKTDCRLVVARRPGPSRNSRELVARPGRCRPDGGGGTGYALAAEHLASSRSTDLRLRPGWVEGHIERSVVVDGKLYVLGWAGSAKSRHPASRVLVFVDRRSVAAVKPTGERPDVARVHGRPLLRSGFSFEVALSDLPEARGRRPTLRLFGVDARKASRLALDCARRPKPFGCP